MCREIYFTLLLLSLVVLTSGMRRRKHPCTLDKMKRATDCFGNKCQIKRTCIKGLVAIHSATTITLERTARVTTTVFKLCVQKVATIRSSRTKVTDVTSDNNRHTHKLTFENYKCTASVNGRAALEITTGNTTFIAYKIYRNKTPILIPRGAIICYREREDDK